MLKSTQPQYQEDIVRMTVVRRFDVEWGRVPVVDGKRRAGIGWRPPSRFA